MLYWLMIGLFGGLALYAMKCENVAKQSLHKASQSNLNKFALSTSFLPTLNLSSSLLKLLTLVIIFTALVVSTHLTLVPQRWVALGLICAFVADLFWFHPRLNKYVALLFFVLASVFYSIAMWLQVSTGLSLGLPIFVLAFGLIVFLLMLPLLDNIIVPACILGSVLIQFVLATAKLMTEHADLVTGYGFAGAVIFGGSALVWAIHYFHQPFKHSAYLIASSYLLAHALIVASVMH